MTKPKKPKKKPEKKEDGSLVNQPKWIGHYKEEYCRQLISHLSRGYSFESFGAEIMVGRSTMYDWLKDHPEWAEAKEVGEASGLRLLEQIAVAKARGRVLKDPATGEELYNPKTADTTMNIFLLKTRFHKIYGDKKEVDHKSSDGSMKPTFIFQEADGSDDDD